jgi:2-oxo-4-hydroxy-4-carboxy-5-ureidoimidazoline decarboxylase
MMTLSQANDLALDDFVANFGDIAEHSPWVAAAAALLRPFTSRESIIESFATVVRQAPETSQLQLIRAHPDLATRAKLTEDSRKEQKGAGLDNLSAEEFRQFTELNDAYKAHFNFPFIFAVKGATKHQILTSFEDRLSNTPQAEKAIAIEQVCRILRFRLEDRIAP